MSDEKDRESAAASPMDMGMEMARKMLARMGKDGPGPMAMMQKMMARMGESGDAGPQMPPMMQMCMGMCAEMLTAIKRTSDLAAFATPELRALFATWLETLEAAAAAKIAESPGLSASELAKALEIDSASAAYLVAIMLRDGRIEARLTVAADRTTAD
jgi:2-hydroxychromene-2-carboxylate isomerase